MTSKPGSLSPLRSHRAIRLAVGLSILAHALLLAIPLRERGVAPGSPGTIAVGPLTVTIEVPEPPVPEPVLQPAPKPERRILTRLKPLAAPDQAAPDQAAPREPAFAVEGDAPREPVREPQFDMMAVINANRERRRAAEAAAARGPAGGAEPSADQIALASINRNLQTLSSGDEGTGGVFQILHKGVRTAEFSFNGWKTESHRRWREVIEVDAGPQGDIEHAIVRRMIELIRGHYSGDFNWESHRLGRVVVLSAAPADNDHLENYLLREFFGTPVLNGSH
jgi:hypothetical protein